VKIDSFWKTETNLFFQEIKKIMFLFFEKTAVNPLRKKGKNNEKNFLFEKKKTFLPPKTTVNPLRNFLFLEKKKGFLGETIFFSSKNNIKSFENPPPYQTKKTLSYNWTLQRLSNLEFFSAKKIEKCFVEKMKGKLS
jgi:hypothetical protein